MGVTKDNSDKKTFDLLANENGVAIAIVDSKMREVYSANNNSICRSLNPSGELSPACAQFCGKALEKVIQTGKIIRYECHAGLECRAVPVKNPNTPLVAIVGRTFVKAENYRKATERAIAGDWSQHSPSKFFENILLAGSNEVLNKTAKQVAQVIEQTKAEKKAQAPKPPVEPVRKPVVEAVREPAVPKARPNPLPLPEERPVRSTPRDISNLVEKFNREIKLEPIATAEILPEKEALPVAETEAVRVADPTPPVVQKERRSAQAQAWRAFFGSLLKTDYPRASESILEFIAAHYGLSSLLWLDKKGDRLENTVAFGDMKHRKVRLGIASGDHRLVDAVQNEIPLELGERAGSGKGHRTMHLFPIGVDGEVSAAIAVLDTVDDEQKRQIVRMANSLAPQLEILRLRSEVARRESLAGAVEKFGQSLKQIDAEGFWLSLLQNAAEFMGAERASLLIFNETTDKLEVKAVVGVKAWTKSTEIGGRIARLVLAKNQPVAVADVASTDLPPVVPDRGYRTPSFLCCPISIGDRTVGVMNFTDKADGGTFGRKAVDLFNAIAPQIAVAIDRASLKNKAGQFEQLSVTDSLTGLLNRRYIEARLAEEIKRSTRHGFPMSFMMLDVDNFKSYNDSFGHPAGDEALKLVGHVVRETLRGADVAARFGGEEFAILLPQTTSDEAIAIGERIRHNIEHAKFEHRRVTVSMGIASCSAQLCVSTDLVSAADKALYEAKRRGRNRVLAFEELGLE
jgi:diguanylate cyclase (GGDEF)-like protein